MVGVEAQMVGDIQDFLAWLEAQPRGSTKELVELDNWAAAVAWEEMGMLGISEMDASEVEESLAMVVVAD